MGRKVSITTFKLRFSGSIYVIFDLPKDTDFSQTDHFEVVWKKRRNSDDINMWFDGYTENVTYVKNKVTYQSVWTYPTSGDDSPDVIRVEITPIAKTIKDGDTEKLAYTDGKLVYKELGVRDEQAPPKPTISPTYEIKKGNKLYVKLENVSIGNATRVKFELSQLKDDAYIEYETKSTSIYGPDTHITFDKALTSGYIYKVRYQGLAKGGTSGEWSDYSPEIPTQPTTPKINSVTAEYKLVSETQNQNGVTVSFTTCKNATKYTFEFMPVPETETTDPNELFNYSSYPRETKDTTDFKDSTKVNVTYTFYDLADKLKGYKCYVRAKAYSESNSSGGLGSITGGSGSSGQESEWSNIYTFIYGKEPSAPTTWQSSSSVYPGDDLKIFFVHNSVDNSILSRAKVKLTVNDEELNELIFTYPLTDFEKLGYNNPIIKKIYKSNMDNIEDNVYVIEINTNNEKLIDGAKLKYKVCTSGVLTINGELVFGKYSEDKEITIYNKPVFNIYLVDHEGKRLEKDYINNADSFKSFPLRIETELGNMTTQLPISCHVKVTSNKGYSYSDDLGHIITVSSGSQIYSGHFDYLSLSETDNIISIDANEMILKNGEIYKVECTYSLSSGLTVSDSKTFIVNWDEQIGSPNADVQLNRTTLTAEIHPTLLDGEDATLYVYRKEYDGTFTKLEPEIQNGGDDYIVDPHPPLNYARYRVVAKSNVTGATSYTDLQPFPVNEKCIVIQWDETWTEFKSNDNYILSDNPWSGSMLKLPYNISMSSSYSPDVVTIDYAGRRHPVSYYGTQVGEIASWSVDIPKKDEETLYAIRRLSIWMGDVYVREPSGSGYWANVNVSFSQKSKSLTIPITFKITRVEGGM